MLKSFEKLIPSTPKLTFEIIENMNFHFRENAVSIDCGFGPGKGKFA